MISSTFPAASVASTTPGSPGTSSSGPNVRLALELPVTLPVPEMKFAVGVPTLAHGPSASIVAAADVTDQLDAEPSGTVLWDVGRYDGHRSTEPNE